MSVVTWTVKWRLQKKEENILFFSLSLFLEIRINVKKRIDNNNHHDELLPKSI